MSAVRALSPRVSPEGEEPVIDFLDRGETWSGHGFLPERDRLRRKLMFGETVGLLVGEKMVLGEDVDQERGCDGVVKS